MSLLKIHKSFRTRHKILKTLYDDQEKANDCFKRVSSKDISDCSKIPLDQLHFYHELLKQNDEIDCCEQDGLHQMYIKEQGRYSYLDEKYLKEGRKLYWDKIYDPLKVILPLITICISVFAIYINSTTSQKLKGLQDQIEALKSQQPQQIVIYRDTMLSAINPKKKDSTSANKSIANSGAGH
jgi:hypothetical protein